MRGDCPRCLKLRDQIEALKGALAAKHSMITPLPDGTEFRVTRFRKIDAPPVTFEED